MLINELAARQASSQLFASAVDCSRAAQNLSGCRSRIERNQPSPDGRDYSSRRPRWSNLEGEIIMATETKLPVTKPSSAPAVGSETWRPFQALRNEIDQIFDDFGSGFWNRPFRSLARLERDLSRSISAPAVDVAESDKAYEITAELPGLDEKNINITVANGALTIKGEKREETEEKKKDYYVSERRYGAFERQFTLPDSVNPDKIEATFKNGVLKVTLPKTEEAQKPAKTINVKAA
jgi:HSP20 family protein